MTANLFDEKPKPEDAKKRGWLQKAVLDYLRSGHTITEDSYNRDFGGSSVSAVIHNLRIRGYFEPDEIIVRNRVKNEHGILITSFRLAKEQPRVDFPQKEQEINPESFGEKPEVGVFAEEPEGISMEMVHRELSAWGSYMDEPENEPSHEDMDAPPEVSSIMVGVKGSQPELVIMFKGDFKPLRHLLTHTEVRYLSMNLEPFMPRRKDT